MSFNSLPNGPLNSLPDQERWEILASQNICTFSTCPLSYAYTSYIPSLAGNIFFAVLFALILIAQLVLGIRHRTWSFTAVMSAGLVAEIMGFVGRVMMHRDPFAKANWLIFFVPLTFGPALFNDAIYLCGGKLLAIYGGGRISWFPPARYVSVWVMFENLSLLLQWVGATQGIQPTTANTGGHTVVAGQSMQVANTLVFVVMCAVFAYRARRHPEEWPVAFAGIRGSKALKTFMAGLVSATSCILVRSCYRVAEFSVNQHSNQNGGQISTQGLRNRFAGDQVTFMAIEGAMVAVACILLTVLHPGPSLKQAWRTADTRLRANRQIIRLVHRESVAGQRPVNDGYQTTARSVEDERHVRTIGTDEEMSAGRVKHYPTDH